MAGASSPIAQTLAFDRGAGPLTAAQALSRVPRSVLRADYVNSPAWIGLSMAQWKSDASKVGIVLSLSEGPFSTVYGAASPCQPKQPACSWQIANFDGVGNYTYPVGALYFSTSGALNYGHYIDPVANSLIEKTITSSSPTAMQAYDAYLADQVPMIWFPMPVDGLDEVSTVCTV